MIRSDSPIPALLLFLLRAGALPLGLALSSCSTLQEKPVNPVGAPPVPDTVFLDIDEQERAGHLPGELAPDETDENDPVKKEEPGEPGPSGPQPPKTAVSDNRPDEKGRPLRTDFYAGTLVREKIDDPTTGQPMVRLSLLGGATILHEKTSLRSPRIVMDGGDRGMLRGGVFVEDKENNLTIRSRNADYLRSKQEVTLTGNPILTVKQENGSTARITCDRIRHDMAESITYLQGDVRIFHGENTLLADRGRYLNSTKIFIIDTDPLVMSNDSYVTGKEIQYLMEQKQLAVDSTVAFYLRGNAPEEEKKPEQTGTSYPDLFTFARTGGRAFLNRKTDGGNQESKEKSTHIITGDRMNYNLKTDEREAEFQLSGNVQITGEDFELQSPFIHTTGDNMNFIVADRGVDILDRDGGARVHGKNLSFDRDKKIMRLEEDILMEFLDDKTGEVNGTMTAAVIVSELESKVTTARGNILIQNQDFEAKAETARYDNAVGIVILEGNPELTRGGSTVQSEKIYIYPDKGKVLLLNGIRGSFGNR